MGQGLAPYYGEFLEMIRPKPTKQQALDQLNSIKAILGVKKYSDDMEGRVQQRHDTALLWRAFMVYETLKIADQQQKETENENQNEAS